MLIILKHVLRNIKEKKGRSILIIISLLIASCVFILNLTIPNQIIEANKNKMRNLVGNSDLVVVGYENFNIKDLKLSNEKINYVGVNQLYYMYNEKTVALISTDLNKAKDLALISNSDLQVDEVIVNKSSAEKFGYKINDTITINVNDKNYNLKIKDIVENKGLLYFKTYSMIVNETTFGKIVDQDITDYSIYYIDVEDDNNVDSFEKYLKENNKNYIVEELVDEQAIKDNNAYVSMILMIIFVMAVVMIFFVVNTLNKMIVIERTPVIATFRSIGATKHKMNLILILENAMYGLIGGILGSILSIFINNLSVRLLLGGEVLNTDISILNLVYGIIFAIGLEILMSISAIIKSNKYSIKELMFDSSQGKYRLNIKSSILSVILITLSIILNLFVSDSNVIVDLLNMVMFWAGVAGIIPLIMLGLSKLICYFARKLSNGSLVIASKNLGYNKMIISSCRLVVISISIMLVIFNVSATFDGMLNSFSYQFDGYDIFIRETSKENKVYEKLNDLDMIERADCVYMFSDTTTYNDGKKFDATPIILGMKSSRPDIIELDYKIEDLKQNEILIDKLFAENNKLKVGDKVKLKLENYNKEFEFNIVGYVNSFYYSIQREIIVVREDYFIDNFTKSPFQVLVTAKENVDLKDVASKIEKELKDPDITIMTVDEFVESQRSNIHTIMYLFYIIIGLAVMLSFVGIINNQIISFMERTKELAVLNSICMSKSQLKKMLIIENITSNIVSCMIGFVVSILSVKLINAVLNGIRMYIDVKFNINLALIFIAVVLVVLFVTVIMPINKLRKIDIVKAIKYE